MLAALLLLSLVPLVALPMTEQAVSDDDENDDELTAEAETQSGQMAETQGSMLDAGFDAEPLQGLEPEQSEDDSKTLNDQGQPEVWPTEQPETVTHSLDSTPGETRLENFVVGSDFVELDLTDVEGEVFFDVSSTENTASVAFAVGPEAVTTLTFEGLTEVPADDIMLEMTDDETGDPFQMSLTDVMDAAAAESLDPMDPEESAQTVGLDPMGEALDPVDPAALVDPTDPLDPLDPADPLAPVDPLDPLDPMDPDAPDPVGDLEPVVDPLGPLDPETPDTPPVLPTLGPVLDPLDPDDGQVGLGLDLSLADLLERDSENLGGIDETLAAASESGVVETTLGALETVSTLFDDGIAGTGQGSIEMGEAAPILSSLDGLEVVDGADGDDVITTGDGAAFAFGGEGNDSLTAGEGAAALYGGIGEDVLSAGDGLTGQFMDGGLGSDQITGGVGGDTLEGGEHGAAVSSGNDIIDGGAGDDLIRGGYGADMLIGGEGDDVIDHLGRTEEREIITQHEFAWHTDGDADTLDGGEGDDTLIFDRSDVATGGAGNDVFWLWYDGADAGDIADVTDFVVGEDFLRVSLNPHIGENDEPEILVGPSADGSDGMVMVNGDLVAILRGAPTATLSDVYAEVRPDVFP